MQNGRMAYTIDLRGVQAPLNDVRIHWNFRGTMAFDRDVAVGATGIEMNTQVNVRDGVDPERAKRLLSSAERYCSTVQTLRHGVEVPAAFSLA
jgi:uncharacterized OsmC-like protein